MKKKKHEHSLFPSTVWELNNYAFVIVEINCAEEDCNYQDWDFGEIKEKE